MKQATCRVSNVTNVEDKNFDDVISILQDNGYEIIWENYPYTALAVIEVENPNEEK